MSEPPEAAQGNFYSAPTGDKHGLTQPSEAQPRLNTRHNPLNQRQQQIKDKARNQKPADAQLLGVSKSFPPKVSFIWYCKHFHGNGKLARTPPLPSSSSSPSLFFLFLPLPSAPTAYFASTSVSLPKEQDHVIFCSKHFDFSPFCYKTNFLNCHSGHGLLCPPISSDLLPPSPVPCSTPATPVTAHTRTFLPPCLCSHGALRSGVRPHNVSTC